MTEFSSIGSRLRQFCDASFGSNIELAEALGIHPANLGKYIRGERNPGLDFLGKIYSVGCNLNWLLTATGSMFADNEAGRRLCLKHEGEMDETTSLHRLLLEKDAEIDALRAQLSKICPGDLLSDDASFSFERRLKEMEIENHRLRGEVSFAERIIGEQLKFHSDLLAEDDKPPQFTLPKANNQPGK